MGDDAKSIRKLRQFYKTRRPVDIERTYAELRGESDRAAVILVAAGLDDTLMIALADKMRPPGGLGEMDCLFGANRPLSSFSAKIDLAFFMGVIDDRSRSQLHDVREMRNACAHSQHPISFADAVLANVCKRVFAPTGVVPLSDAERDGNLKSAFLIEMAMLEMTLITGREKMMEEVASIRRIMEGIKIERPDA